MFFFAFLCLHFIPLLILLNEWFVLPRSFFHPKGRQIPSSSPHCHRMCCFICFPSFLTTVNESPSKMMY
ncbi:hypothetical protein ES288_D04G151100v1 [Gossypium darwinii]|uniref:Secreted protein n=1 Tax=Gossypium darwinii TaxID=34276 RepID=A0A5D2D1A1_GOSDA|nr:hypothetical protein ES288_D04G151100v1 [Gossypium darwinii]